MPPGGGPPVMHRHAPSEIYRVLSGELVFCTTTEDGTSRRVASPARPSPFRAPRHTDPQRVGRRDGRLLRPRTRRRREGFARAAATLAAEAPPTSRPDRRGPGARHRDARSGAGRRLSSPSVDAAPTISVNPASTLSEADPPQAPDGSGHANRRTLSTASVDTLTATPSPTVTSFHPRPRRARHHHAGLRGARRQVYLASSTPSSSSRSRQ